jgi:hypothetical protein
MGFPPDPMLQDAISLQVSAGVVSYGALIGPRMKGQGVREDFGTSPTGSLQKEYTSPAMSTTRQLSNAKEAKALLEELAA